MTPFEFWSKPETEQALMLVYVETKALMMSWEESIATKKGTSNILNED